MLSDDIHSDEVIEYYVRVEWFLATLDWQKVDVDRDTITFRGSEGSDVIGKPEVSALVETNEGNSQPTRFLDR